MTRVEMPDGTIIEFPDGTPPEVMTQVARDYAQRGQSAEPEVIGTFGDDGRILRGQDGRLQAVSAGGATTDQATVERIMQGDSFASSMQQDIDQERIGANPVAARVNEVVRGTPFVGSYADEAVGMVSPDARDNMRSMTEAMRRENPGETLALNVAGGIAGSIPMALAAAPGVAATGAGMSRGAQALSGIGAGAVAGGVEGAVYGSGEGTTQGERRRNARVGGAIGAGAGAVLGAASPYAAEGINAVLNRFRRSDVSQIASGLKISREAAGVIRDAMDTGDMTAAAAALRRAGPEAMLADAGVPGKKLLDATIQAGTRPAEIALRHVGPRVARSTQMMKDALDDGLGAPRGINEMRDEIRTSTSGARSSAYDAAYAQPIDYSSRDGQAIERLFQRVPNSAWAKAQRLMDLKGEESAQRIVTIGPSGQIERTEVIPDVRTIDYLTRALRDIADETDGKGKLGGQTDEGRAVRNLQTQLRQLTRRAVPEYGDALDTAGDAIGRSEAIRDGESLFRRTTTREDVARSVARMSGAERRAMRQGLRSYVDEMTANAKRTITEPSTEPRQGVQIMKDFSSEANRDKLRVVMGDREANQLMDAIDEASVAFELRGAIADGSGTAIRRSIQRGVDEVAEGGALRTLMRGEPVDAAKRLTQVLTGETAEAQELRRMGIYQDIARALTEAQGGRARAALRLIESAMSREARVSPAQARVVTEALLSGNLTGTSQLSRELAR